jgi:hypothetical protein
MSAEMKVNNKSKQDVFLVSVPEGTSLNKSLNGEPLEFSNSDIPYGDTAQIVELSDKEFAIGIWLFGVDKYGMPHPKSLYRQGLLEILEQRGYYKRFRDNGTYFFIQEINNIIRQVEPVHMKTECLDYVLAYSLPAEFKYKKIPVEVSAKKLREIFLKQSHLIFNDAFLEHLPEHTKPVLKDTKERVYFYFKNKVVAISSTKFKEYAYADLEGYCVWESYVNRHTFRVSKNFKDGHFYQFICNVANKEEDRITSFTTAIGYLLHNYSSRSKGQAIIFYDEQITNLGTAKGGTGKGAVAQAIQQIRDVIKIDGKKFDPSDKFKWQDITDHTQVVWLDDPRPALDFSTFHSCLTDGWSIEKKHRDQFYIKPENSPKLLIASNSVLKGEGSTNRRRQFIVEFGNYYQKRISTGVEEPIKDVHGCTFFDDEDWKQDEWDKFFTFMLYCVRTYLQDGLQVYDHRNLKQNKITQSCGEDFAEWVEHQDFQLEQKYTTTTLYSDFRDTYYGEGAQFAQRGFTNLLKKYATIRNWELRISRSNGISFFTFYSHIPLEGN